MYCVRELTGIILVPVSPAKGEFRDCVRSEIDEQVTNFGASDRTVRRGSVFVRIDGEETGFPTSRCTWDSELTGTVNDVNLRMHERDMFVPDLEKLLSYSSTNLLHSSKNISTGTPSVFARYTLTAGHWS